MAIYSAKTAAAKLGCSVRTVQRIAARLNLGTPLGLARIFSEADLPKIRKAIQPVGQPAAKSRGKSRSIK